MELKLFGKKIFEFSTSGSNALVWNSQESLNVSKFLPDFHSMRAKDNFEPILWSTSTSTNPGMEVIQTIEGETPKIKPKMKTVFSPKKVFELKFLNKKNFSINADPKYVEEQISVFKEKLNLIKVSEFDMSRGTNEIASILIRFENRKKYEDNRKFFEDFAYTTTERINSVVKNHGNLQLGKVEQFIADMPKEAILIMKDYTGTTEKLSGKKPVFYIIADKKDFEKSDQRRDPILLAQSPFGHFWQILGAWGVDDMLLLEDL